MLSRSENVVKDLYNGGGKQEISNVRYLSLSSPDLLILLICSFFLLPYYSFLSSCQGERERERGERGEREEREREDTFLFNVTHALENGELGKRGDESRTLEVHGEDSAHAHGVFEARQNQSYYLRVLIFTSE
jgi:hypothetical protein